jgi:hypothetical protein
MAKYGLLIDEKAIKIHRKYFKEMVKLIGVGVKYYAPRPDKTWTTYSEIVSNYFEPEDMGCIFQEHPDQKTLKMLGWATELQDSPAIISVPYDLKYLQYGALFELPSAIDGADSRLFRVVELSTAAIYPASITCKLMPEFKNSFTSDNFNHATNSLTLLNEEDSCL